MTWDWTQISQTIDEHSTHGANIYIKIGNLKVPWSMEHSLEAMRTIQRKKGF